MKKGKMNGEHGQIWDKLWEIGMDVAGLKVEIRILGAIVTAAAIAVIVERFA